MIFGGGLQCGGEMYNWEIGISLGLGQFDILDDTLFNLPFTGLVVHVILNKTIKYNILQE